MHLQRPVVRHDGLLNRVAHLCRFVVGGVEGINADARQNNAGLLKDVGLDPSRDAVDIVDGEGVRQLDVHGAVVLVRAVIEERHVVSAEHVLLRADDLLKLLRRFRVLALADYVVQRFDHHLDTGFDDKARDDHADVRFERNAPDEIDDCRGEHRRRQYRVEQGVGARGLERAGADLFALLFDVEPEHELNGYRHADYYERYRAVIRRFGMDDLFDRLDERRDARVEHERGDDHGAQVFDPAVAEGMLLIRLFRAELRADDRHDGGERVGEVVYRVENDGDRVRNEPDERLEPDEQQVRDYAYDARFYDRFLSVRREHGNVAAIIVHFDLPKQFLDRFPDVLHIDRRLEAGDDVPLAVDEELCEVPADIGLVAVLLVVHGRKLIQRGVFQTLPEALERLFRGQPGKQRIGCLAVDVDLFELRELGAEFHGAEGVDLLLVAGGLIGELVAGEVEYFKALIAQILIHRLKRIVMRREAASGSGVDDQQHLPAILGKADVVPHPVLYGEIIDCLHCFYLLFHYFSGYPTVHTAEHKAAVPSPPADRCTSPLFPGSPLPFPAAPGLRPSA